MIEARALTKWYPGVRAVSDVSFTVSPGEILGYLGPNGSGKTTTVGMLIGTVEPSSGAVLFRGAPITDDLIEYRRQVGYVPEEPHLYPFLSGREYLELVADLRDLDCRTSRKRIDALLDLFGLGADAGTALGSYSKGMRQKVLISAALVHDPALLIFDEPTSGLDAVTALVFRHIVDELARSGKAVLLSSHELDTVERSCTRVLVLHHGLVVAHDTAASLRQTLSKGSLEAVFRDLVCEIDPGQVASDVVQAMRLAP